MSNLKCDIPLLYIDERECLGDVVGKINYNFVVAETIFCNISSFIKNYDLNFLDFLEEYTFLEENAIDITSNYRNEIILAATTVNLLSSFWGHYEFSIQIPLNAVTLPLGSREILAPVLAEPIEKEKVEIIVDKSLKNIAEFHLNSNYLSQNYFEGTVINVSFFLYNQVPVIKEPNSDVDPLVKETYEDNSAFSFNKRTMSVSYTRSNIHFTTGVILRFVLFERRWVYLGFILNQDIFNAQPDSNYPVIFPTPTNQLKQTFDNNQNLLLSECEEIQENTWYSLREYVFASALYSGTSSRRGTITLTLKTVNNDIKTFQHKANGYNPNTNTGGTDVYIEIYDDIINVYEQYPTPKTLVNSFVNPFKDSEGVNYRFNFDNSGVERALCASKFIE
jgi:hypothetical protein